MESIDPSEHRKALIEEYKEAGHLHRLHIGLMFGQITVFLGSFGALAHRVAANPPLEPSAMRILAVFGFFLSAMFFIVHERMYSYSHGARTRAEEIQALVGFSLYQYRPMRFRLLQGRSAKGFTVGLYVLCAAFWVWVFFATPTLLAKPGP